MSLNARLSTLQQRHATLETRLADEDQRPRPNAQELERLKRDKLRLKDEIERMKGTATRH
jgi:hypothetical protein